MTTYYEDLLVGATSLKGLSGILIDDWSGLLDLDVLRGANEVVPGLPGEVGVELVRDAYDFAVPFNLKGATRVEFLTRYAALRALFPTTLVTLTRRLTQTASPFYSATTCNGQYRGITITAAFPHEIDGVLNLRNLDGAWA